MAQSLNGPGMVAKVSAIYRFSRESRKQSNRVALFVMDESSDLLTEKRIRKAESKGRGDF